MKYDHPAKKFFYRVRMSTRFPPIIHMFSTRWFRWVWCVGVLLVVVRTAAAQTPAQGATLYRIFLHDGSTLVSYGEFARVADTVVFSIPVGGTDQAPKLQLISIPASSVDWDQTDAYAESARADRYAATRGPEDFAALNQNVSSLLGQIALTDDPKRKIDMATQARQIVMRWEAEHYGYRAQDVAGLATMFDTVISEARKASGLPSLNLALVANTASPPTMPLWPPPTIRDTVSEGLAAASLITSSTEREAALRALRETLDDQPASSWVTGMREKVDAALAVEERLDVNYAGLAKRTMRQADRDVRTGSVTSLQQLIARALGDDDRLGRKRPEEMASLLALLDSRLDSARAVHLAREHWATRIAALRKYQAQVSLPLATITAWRPSLEQIRDLAGPSQARLDRLSSAIVTATTQLAAIEPPPEASDVHGLLRTVLQLAGRAADGREDAISTGEMQTAWEASSAAAGALLFLQKVNDDLKALMTPPVSPNH